MVLPKENVHEHRGRAYDIPFTSLLMRGVIGIDQIPPDIYLLRNRYLDGTIADHGEVNKLNYKLIDKSKSARKESDGWRNIVIDSYNSIGVALHSERYDELKAQGCFAWSSAMGYSNGPEQGFISSIEVGGVEFKDIFVTRLTVENFDVVGISALRQRKLAIEVVGANAESPRLMKLHVSEDFDQHYIDDRLFCSLFRLSLNRNRGCLVVHLEEEHPLAKYLSAGDVITKNM